MIRIECPWCGPRNEEEFTYGGPSHIVRPENPEDVSDQEWSQYLYHQDNPKGLHRERWCHTYGCRQWFNVARDTISHEVKAIYKMGDPRPELGGADT